MTVKTTGLEWKAFYNDPKYWLEDYWHDGEAVEINGMEIADPDFDLHAPEDTDMMKVTGGCIFNDAGNEISGLEQWFRKWRKEQATTTVLMSVPNDKLEALKQAARLIPGVRIL